MEVIHFQQFKDDGTNMTFKVEFFEVVDGKNVGRGQVDVTLPLDANEAAIEAAVTNARPPGILARNRVQAVLDRLNKPAEPAEAEGAEGAGRP